MSARAGIDLSLIFNQYLRTINIPVLEYKIEQGSTFVRWNNCVDGFNMKLRLANSSQWISPTTEFKEVQVGSKLEIDPNFFITVKKVS